ncbi:uncharacterized protein G2W53_033509 [Senna tora]|uniref:Uncharacterized protein n=1 Tax=Senna tora TaxID=362788 RepID=A0A834SZA0_9FABA|nr:uncharacterized protein G2W53_033509 [Senna tora]
MPEATLVFLGLLLISTMLNTEQLQKLSTPFDAKRIGILNPKALPREVYPKREAFIPSFLPEKNHIARKRISQTCLANKASFSFVVCLKPRPPWSILLHILLKDIMIGVFDSSHFPHKNFLIVVSHLVASALDIHVCCIW